MTLPRALIAEDEPLLARTLRRMLAQAWPELQIAALAEDGFTAVQLALELAPEVVFLDIRMPGRSGLEAAACIADEWPDERAAPLFVFVTAHDEFALQAFDQAAVDYLLKPVSAQRLARTVARLKQTLAQRAPTPGRSELAALVQRVQRVQGLPAPVAPAEPLIKVIRASVGNAVRMIPVADVICFEAADKYVNVVSAGGEALVRMSLREMIARIDASDFVQVHRRVMVNNGKILSATRDEAGHYSLKLQGLARPLKVSRAFGHLFRPM